MNKLVHENLQIVTSTLRQLDAASDAFRAFLNQRLKTFTRAADESEENWAQRVVGGKRFHVASSDDAWFKKNAQYKPLEKLYPPKVVRWIPLVQQCNMDIFRFANSLCR
jgi:hypothetical protein